MTDLPFVSALVQADLPVWEQCLQTEFLQKMENGTLSEDCFKSYLVEDSLYLREYAKIFAWGMTKATTMAAMRTYYSLLSFVQENEDLTRLQYLEAVRPAGSRYPVPAPAAGEPRLSGLHDRCCPQR